MKMYTNESQTTKLIELGFEKPKSIRYSQNEEEVGRVDSTDFLISDYSIGELIELLGYDLYSIHYKGLAWEVKSERVETRESELIDALYKMILKLKEDGVI